MSDRSTSSRPSTDRLRQETQRLGLRSIVVGPSMTEDDLTGQVTHAFGI